MTGFSGAVTDNVACPVPDSMPYTSTATTCTVTPPAAFGAGRLADVPVLVPLIAPLIT